MKPDGEIQQTIFRVASRHKPYSQLGNPMLRDGELSLEARGALAFILSYPPDWTFNFKWFCKFTRCGRDRAQRIIREIIKAKYGARYQGRDARGRVSRTEYWFTDEKGSLVDQVEPQPEKPVAVETEELPATVLAGAGSSGVGQPAPTKKDSPNQSPSRGFKQSSCEAGFAGEKRSGGTDLDEVDRLRIMAANVEPGPVGDLVAATAGARTVDLGVAGPRPPMRLDRDGERFTISDKDRRSIEALGGDVEELFDRTMVAKAKAEKEGRRIGNVVRYMVTIAKNDLASKQGVEIGVAQDLATGNTWDKRAAYAVMLKTPKPLTERERARLDAQLARYGLDPSKVAEDFRTAGADDYRRFTMAAIEQARFRPASLGAR